jgi:hypothetical protein
MAVPLSQIILRTHAIWLELSVLIATSLETVEHMDPTSPGHWSRRGDIALSGLSERRDCDPLAKDGDAA